MRDLVDGDHVLVNDGRRGTGFARESFSRASRRRQMRRQNLDGDKPIGRRLDFLMQEMNREANTLGSKSIDIDTTRASVDLKVLIEQMREQIQNIE